MAATMTETTRQALTEAATKLHEVAQNPLNASMNEATRETRTQSVEKTENDKETPRKLAPTFQHGSKLKR